MPRFTVGVKVMDRVRAPRPKGHTKRPTSLSTDKSYDSADFQWELRRRGTQPSISSWWKVERSHGWLDNLRRLVTSYDWYTESWDRFMTTSHIVWEAIKHNSEKDHEISYKYREKACSRT
jgi:hypothetical protein